MSHNYDKNLWQELVEEGLLEADRVDELTRDVPEWDCLNVFASLRPPLSRRVKVKEKVFSAIGRPRGKTAVAFRFSAVFVVVFICLGVVLYSGRRTSPIQQPQLADLPDQPAEEETVLELAAIEEPEILEEEIEFWEEIDMFSDDQFVQLLESEQETGVEGSI